MCWEAFFRLYFIIINVVCACLYAMAIGAHRHIWMSYRCTFNFSQFFVISFLLFVYDVVVIESIIIRRLHRYIISVLYVLLFTYIPISFRFRWIIQSGISWVSGSIRLTACRGNRGFFFHASTCSIYQYENDSI